jgi:hypothetical protein
MLQEADALDHGRVRDLAHRDGHTSPVAALLTDSTLAPSLLCRAAATATRRAASA